jgi:hypothetical protein
MLERNPNNNFIKKGLTFFFSFCPPPLSLGGGGWDFLFFTTCPIHSPNGQFCLPLGVEYFIGLVYYQGKEGKLCLDSL